jgi:hypothetical protein
MQKVKHRSVCIQHAIVMSSILIASYEPPWHLLYHKVIEITRIYSKNMFIY